MNCLRQNGHTLSLFAPSVPLLDLRISTDCNWGVMYYLVSHPMTLEWELLMRHLVIGAGLVV